MDGEPSLPRLPAVAWSPHSQSIRTRKRGDVEAVAPSLSHNSSDPAWFSSDDDPAAENYVQGRRKKRYVGSWFSQQEPLSTAGSHDLRDLDDSHRDGPSTPTVPHKRTFQRQFDSGVWMGSDATTDEMDDISAKLPTPMRPGFQLPTMRCKTTISLAEQGARDHIQHCLENSEENIDLTARGLDSLSNETVAPLSEFSCIPIVEKEVAFENKEPCLELYLSRNNLLALPGAIFQLKHLAVLSVRGNDLPDLPPAVMQLCNLEELNVSQNFLRHLPADLLSLASPLGKLKKLHIHPNPFCQPKQLAPIDEKTPQDGYSDEYGYGPVQRLRDGLGAHRASYHGYTARILARSPVHYTDSTGASYSQFNLSVLDTMPDGIPTEALDSDPSPPAARHSEKAALPTTRVPSLVELSLLAAYKTSQLGAIPDYLDDETPEQIRQAVYHAIKQKEEGGRHCTVCGRLMVMARTGWLEWWELGKVTLEGGDLKLEPLSKKEDEKAVPFLRQGCSWKCVPRRVEKRDWLGS